MVLIKKEEEEVEESRGNKLYQERERERGLALHLWWKVKLKKQASVSKFPMLSCVRTFSTTEATNVKMSWKPTKFREFCRNAN